MSFPIQISNYEDWPYKIIYAIDGLKAETILDHINEFYAKNTDIPIHRRPNMIHVTGKYLIMRAAPEMKLISPDGTSRPKIEAGTYQIIRRDSDLQAIIWALNYLQERAAFSTEILFQYGDLINKVHQITEP